ncbi:MAG: LysR substrate-binding domain-containing protein [Cognatishimia sp.]
MNEIRDYNLRHVRSFLEVARLESVSHAANALNLTQPAVSRSIKELEAALGTPLFDRVGRGLKLNGAGRVFQIHAAASLTELLRGQDRVSATKKVSARLSIGVLPTASTDLVPNAALAFHAQAQHVQLHILTGPNWLLFNQLRERQLDLVVGRMPEGDDLSGLTFEQLYLETVCLVSRPGHPVLQNPDLSTALRKYTLIMPPKGAVIFETVTRYLASLGLGDIRPEIETVALPIGRRIVQSSDALWFISRGVVDEEIETGRLAAVEIKSPMLSGPVGISQLKRAPLDVERSVFAKCLRQASTKQQTEALL